MKKVTVEVYDSCELSANWLTYPSDYEPIDVKEKFQELKEVIAQEFGEDVVELVLY